ncbi:MAG: transketolase [Gammaproteobacteria bacterium]
MDDVIPADRLETMPVDELCIQTIRTLAMDAVEKANSGHPGTPMALAPAAYVLWSRFLRFNPRRPDWTNRDRFVLSNGHASMLLYAMLHLSGYDLSLEQLKQFRQWGSLTPGHPEYGVTPGVETTTGPLGQGLMTAVGMAIAEAHLAATFNRPGHALIDHHTYVFCGDGDLMEGASHEAASVAGHLGLGKLICLYDDNHISIDGDTAITYSDDVAGRFEAYHWHVQDLGDQANDLAALERAFQAAVQEPQRPSLIIVRSHIAYGAPHAHDTAAAHGAPLGADEVRATKQAYGWPADAVFLVPEQVRTHMRQAGDRGEHLHGKWEERLRSYGREHPELAQRFGAALQGELPDGWDQGLGSYSTDDKPVATRAVAGKVLGTLTERIPWLIGGAADLVASTKTVVTDGGDFGRERHDGRNIHWGIREHVMCAASTGMALHGGLRPFASTFFIFSDYARPAIRLAALMKQPVIYVFTHDSVGLGEDGPTHQPIEQLASLRAMPDLCVIRPADANETVAAWKVALARRDGPTMLVLTRQKLPVLEAVDDGEGVACGAYVFARERGEQPELILIASGSELVLTLKAQEQLRSEYGIDARVVSMPSWELFRAQPGAYRETVLPAAVRSRLAVEAAATFGWREWVGERGDVLGIDHFGASAPGPELFRQFGFTVDNVVARARRLVEE